MSLLSHRLQHGAVIVFPEHYTAERCAEVLERIAADIDWSYYVAKTTEGLVQDFNPDEGGPVWYIP